MLFLNLDRRSFTWFCYFTCHYSHRNTLPIISVVFICESFAKLPTITRCQLSRSYSYVNLLPNFNLNLNRSVIRSCGHAVFHWKRHSLRFHSLKSSWCFSTILITCPLGCGISFSPRGLYGSLFAMRGGLTFEHFTWSK